MNKSYYIYIVECSDKSFYTGVTNSIEKRLQEHNQGIDRKCYTYQRRPVKLRYLEIYNDINQAIIREKQIKRWSRKKKQALIDNKQDELSKLARGKRGYKTRKKKIKS